ncbi:MAG: hypothetical protein MJK04_34825 [Psychrosphaera sp.]|nr:hypothetical protein [Psychrosphaera sp.]
MKIFIAVLTATLLLMGTIWFATSEEYAPINQIIVTDLNDVFEVITGQYQSEPQSVQPLADSLDVYLDFVNDEETCKAVVAKVDLWSRFDSRDWRR